MAPAATQTAGGLAVPRHIAVIMDGNGRWAEQRSLPRAAGHRAGTKAVRTAIEESVRHGVGALTLFAFSSENWQRPAGEVSLLMQLFLESLDREVAELDANGVRIRFIGDRARLAPALTERMAAAEARTAANGKLDLVDRRRLRRALGHRTGGARARGCDRGRPMARGGHRRAGDRRPPRDVGPAGAGPFHPHGRRAAHQQFPALGPRLHGALVHRHSLA
jgi:undecaprenyl pyrophosphate synthase